MKTVTLYRTMKEEVQTFNMESITQYQYLGNSLKPIRNSDMIVDSQRVRHIHLPIQRFCWNGHKGYQEIYAAFDEELLDIIGCSQEKFKRDVERKVTDTLVKEHYNLLNIQDKYNKIEQMSFWQSLKWCFKKLSK